MRAQNNTVPYDFSNINSKIQGWVDSGYYTGASIIIVKDNSAIFEKYDGSYNTETVVYIASAGKWLAAATIAAIVWFRRMERRGK